MFDWLSGWISGQPLSYLVVLGVAGLDVIFPLLPSETVVITAAAVAAHGGLSIWLVILAAATGGFMGDNVSFLLGRKAGSRVARFLFRGKKGRERLDWAERAVRRRGVLLIFVGRFLPGGRTASTFAAGTLGMPWRRFAVADAIAAAAWGTYAGLLGYLGGEAFRHSLWKPLLGGVAIATFIGALIEGYRQAQKRRGRDVFGDRLEPQS